MTADNGTVARALAAGVALLRAALPQYCALCTAPCRDGLLCDPCLEGLPRLPAACPSCALPAASATTCGACLRRPPPHARAVAAFAYAFPVDRLVARLKYGHDLALAPALAAPLARSVQARYADTPMPDAIVPLPLSRARQRGRGFNQACEIARPLAAVLGVALCHALARERDAPAQASLPRARRAANVRGAFAADAALRGLRIAIVDDVMTTGATLAAAAQACRRAGACEVDVWVVARTLRPGRA